VVDVEEWIVGQAGFIGVGMGVNVLLYTHSSMSDVWPAFLGRLEKFLPQKHKLHVAINEESIDISGVQLIYDESLPYTERLKSVLSNFGRDETILFIHEDMILYDVVDVDRFNRYWNYVESGLANSIKLILVGDTFNVSGLDSELVFNSFARFSIQPTIIKVKTLLKLLNAVPSNNIWKFEDSISVGVGDYMPRLGGEVKRGWYHYDTTVFPYIATAISKGRWNVSEYPIELSEVSSEYGIQLSKRGVT
jgi:hypothetical protein